MRAGTAGGWGAGAEQGVQDREIEAGQERGLPGAEPADCAKAGLDLCCGEETAGIAFGEY